MSDIAAAPIKPPRSHTKIIILILLLLFLSLGYGAGFFALPMSLLLSYQNRNCDSVITLHKTYRVLYPDFIEDPTLSSPVEECKAYTLATSYEENESWQQAYDAYRMYSETYSSGLYSKEAHEHSAAALLNMAQDQLEQEKYHEALANSNLIVASYSDTAVTTEAWDLIPSIYTPWGAGLRESGDFIGSEQVLNEFKTWSLTNQKNDSTTCAQRELAQTYLAWGLDLKSQAQFESAIAKFELAVAADPESPSDFAEKIRAGQSNTYIDWGDALLEQDQFPVAMEKFELAISKSGGTSDDAAADAWANGHIKWANHLSAEEDFEGALEHLGLAGKAAISDAMQKSVDTARQDIYLAFSKSTGSQARRVMKEALKSICEQQKAPVLPIFGLNNDSIRFGIYGVEDQLPENFAARTPGEMHYIVCIKPDNKTVETRLHKNVVLDFGRYDFYTLVEQFRVQVIWDVSLVGTSTGESDAEETFTGELPPPFSETGGNYIYGSAPMEELKLWLESFTH